MAQSRQGVETAALPVKEAEGNSPDLSTEDIEKLKNDSLQELQKNLRILSSMYCSMNDKGEFSESFQCAIFRVRKAYYALHKAPFNEQRTYRKTQGEVIFKEGGVKILCDVVVYCIQKGYRDAKGKIIKDLYLLLFNCASTLQNFSDAKPEHTILLIEHPSFMNICRDYIKDHFGAHMDQEIQKEDSRVLNQLMSVIHNIGNTGDHTTALRGAGYVEILTPYLNSPVTETLLIALSTLAGIVDEAEAQRLEANGDFFEVLKSYLSNALTSFDRRHKGWRAAELGRTVRHIARNDAHKKALVENGFLPLLVKLARSDFIEEKREGVGALWTLSFNDTNQDAMIDSSCGVIQTFVDLRDSSDSKVNKACYSALWNMRKKLVKSERYGDRVREIQSYGEENITENASARKKNNGGHVMISYQWGFQSTAKQLRDFLRRNNVRVWMDIDDMAGSTLVAMARAVEEADIVLICYSQKYKKSDNCRAEAEYAFQMKKTIIPLKLERNYIPDGWLGFIIGTKLYYDFSECSSFESCSDRLLKAIFKILKRDLPDGLIIPQRVVPVGYMPAVRLPAVATSTSIVQQIPHSQVPEKAGNWTNSQVFKWIEKHGLSKCQFGQLTGIEIAFLQDLRKEVIYSAIYTVHANNYLQFLGYGKDRNGVAMTEMEQ